MTYAQLVQEVVDRGFDYLTASRIEAWVHRHHQRLEAKYVWPWRETSKEGTAPLEIKDLRDVLSVTDSTQERPIFGQARQWLAERFPNLEEEGNPIWWWLDNLKLQTFPTSKDTIVVRYASKPAELTAEAEPDMPEEWQGLIVDSAVVECLKDNGEANEARELKEAIQAELGEMIGSELQRDLQRPQLMVRTGSPFDYL